MLSKLLSLFVLCILLFSCSKENPPSGEETPGELSIVYVYIGESALASSENTENVAIDELIQIRFDKAVNPSGIDQNIILTDSENKNIPLTFSFFNENQLVKISHSELDQNMNYLLSISNNLKGENDEVFIGKTFTFTTLTLPLILESLLIDDTEYNPASRIENISRVPVIELNFNSDISTDDVLLYSSYKNNNTDISFSLTQLDANTITVLVPQEQEGFSKFTFSISSDIENKIDRPFEGLELDFYTEVDSTPKFPLLSDDELLTLIQRQTFKYFWDFGHPVSGLARERNTSGETVTSGGSGFGLMAIIVGIERGFITRSEGVERLQTIVDFLGESDRFHGAWSHWLDGTTGKAKPFSTKDNGGDLVETSYLAAGLLAVRQYLKSSSPVENVLISKINDLWSSIEWDWYTQDGQNVLYWHWSPNYDWDMNMKIQGYNEALITYIMAASSATHPVSADVYNNGWARNGGIANGKEFYGIELPVGYNYGGPLFFAHYSFLGIDPRNLSDQYADYWEQNRNHSLINHAHCVENPNHFVGYNSDCWGLTASDNHEGYSAHSPTNDLGVISPTAAISSLPYTPEESMDAIRFFYYTLGDRLWGEYGFYDAFNVTESWTASSFLAIDQGPMIIMIENYRTGLIWDLLMSSPEVQAGLSKLGFTY